MLTGVNPIEMTRQMLHQAAFVTADDTSLLHVARLLMPFSIAAPLLMLAALGTTVWAGWRFRHSSPLVATSVAAVMGRICLYHRQYDNHMLLFPLLALGMMAFSIRRFWAWGVFIGFGVTLWLPIRYANYNSGTILWLSIHWTASVAILCWQHAALNRVPRGPLSEIEKRRLHIAQLRETAKQRMLVNS
jgi:hypothetical protein